MGFLDRFRGKKPVDIVTTNDVEGAVSAMRREFFGYAKANSHELKPPKIEGQVVNFLNPSSWLDGSEGQSLARKLVDAENEEKVALRPEEFFGSKGVEVLPPEKKSKNRLEFLDWGEAEDDEITEDILDYLEVVLQEVRQKKEQLNSLIRSLEEIIKGGLPLSQNAKNEAKRLLRDVQSYKDEDDDFSEFLANPRIIGILDKKGDQADLSVQRNTNDLLQEFIDLDRAMETLRTLIAR